MIELIWEVVEGPHKGRRIYDHLNLWHDNEKVVNIAKARLSSLCRAVAVLRPKDTAELHGKAVFVAVRQKDEGIKITGYLPVGGEVTIKVDDSEEKESPPWRR